MIKVNGREFEFDYDFAFYLDSKKVGEITNQIKKKADKIIDEALKDDVNEGKRASEIYSPELGRALEQFFYCYGSDIFGKVIQEHGYKSAESDEFHEFVEKNLHSNIAEQIYDILNDELVKELL